MFLFNISEIGGNQLGFVSEDDWPGAHLAWAYERMIKEGAVPDEGHFKKLYKITMWVLVAQLFLQPLMFVTTDFSTPETSP